MRLARAIPTAESNVDARRPPPLRWLGVNGFARPSDPAVDIPYSTYGRYLRDRGDAGVIAIDAAGEIAGWLWIREGPSLEQAGPGYIEIPHGSSVAHDLKVHPSLRGLGLGHQLFAELGQRMPFDRAKPLLAIVSPDNTPSLACVARAGFREMGIVDVRRIAGVRLTRAVPASGL